MDVYFDIYDMNMNLVNESFLHFNEGKNYFIINYYLEEYKSYIFLCRNQYMLKCRRFVTLSYK